MRAGVPIADGGRHSFVAILKAMWLVVFSGNGAPSIITAQLTATVMTDQGAMVLGYHQENEKRNDREMLVLIPFTGQAGGGPGKTTRLAQ